MRFDQSGQAAVGRVALTSVMATFLTATAATGQAAPQAPGPVTLPTVTVTARKEPADVRTVPASITVVSADVIAAGGMRVTSDAAILSANTVFTEFSARKASNPRVRGIGASPGNPAITTYIDGVPHLSSNTSSLELIDVAQIEFIRGSQSSLFGRNAIGGVVNIASGRPSLTRWRGNLEAPLGDFGSRELRAGVSGPVGGRVAVGASFGRQRRDGYSTNEINGSDVDFRDGTFGKAQVLWVPTDKWETRLIYSGEKDRDGDYALNDLQSTRDNPFHLSRDFIGYTHRNLHSTAFQVRYEGSRFALTSSTGVIRWATEDETDLDYTAMPVATRKNEEEAAQVTQEVRLATAVNAPMRLSDSARLKWQVGLAYFTQDYDQLAINSFAPFVLSPILPIPVRQTSPDAKLNDRGTAAFGEATLLLKNSVDLTGGVRFDRESKEADLSTSYAPPLAPPTMIDSERAFSDVSPHFAVAYQFRPTHRAYASISRGFKAGGFNPASPAGVESYNEEHAWHAEAGIKSRFFGGRVAASAAAFQIDWHDMQLNVPNALVPGQFYISNVGSATSRGAEIDVVARVLSTLDLFTSVGYTDAQFGAGSASMGVDVAGKAIPFTPSYTAVAGMQLSRSLTGTLTLYGRAETAFYGRFMYDDSNLEGQPAYALTNLRIGVRARRMSIEGWTRNAFDTRYVPVAFRYDGFAPSGYVGEPGAPRTLGVRLGVSF